MTALDQIARHSLRAEAVKRIRAAIVYGEIEPGRIHSAPALAAQLGVSITPVREALLELTHRGMVSQVRNRGFVVAEPSREAVAHALELRELVEVPMLKRLKPTDAAAFRDVVEEGIEAARRDDLAAFLDLDRAFHLGLLERAGNPRVVEVVDQVHDQLRLAGFVGHLLPVAEGHRAILDAIAAGDPGAVERAAREHLALTRG